MFYSGELRVNEKLGYKRIINCTNAVELKYIEKYLYKVRYKWENKISKIYVVRGKGMVSF
jgi:hypothetical protein